MTIEMMVCDMQKQSSIARWQDINTYLQLDRKRTFHWVQLQSYRTKDTTYNWSFSFHSNPSRYWAYPQIRHNKNATNVDSNKWLLCFAIGGGGGWLVVVVGVVQHFQQKSAHKLYLQMYVIRNMIHLSNTIFHVRILRCSHVRHISNNLNRHSIKTVI